MSEIKNIFDETNWLDAEGYPEGTKIKTLREEDGYKTAVLKLPKGFQMEAHSHITTEQHFVLKGEYEIQGEVFKVGSYQLIHSGVDHGPSTSNNGVTILVIWEKR